MYRNSKKRKLIKVLCNNCIYAELASLLPLLSGIGCNVSLPYSILNPAGSFASSIAWFSWLMIIVYGIVFGITIAILIAALLTRKRENPILGTRFVILSGIILPTAILLIMLAVELRISQEVSPHNAKEDLTVQVIGHGWWFEVRYPGFDIVDANEIHVPVDKLVRYELWSSGMIHSFWIPRLGGKRDQNPEHANTLYLIADTTGIYPGVCAEYCAGQHARMAFRLVAHTMDDFLIWVKQYQLIPTAPAEPYLSRGISVFMNGGCHSCHTVRGLGGGNIGPDLTHIGSRLTIGAGQFDNSEGTLAGWIANSQALKPENLMPRTYLYPDSLHYLVAYLRSLK